MAPDMDDYYQLCERYATLQGCPVRILNNANDNVFLTINNCIAPILIHWYSS